MNTKDEKICEAITAMLLIILVVLFVFQLWAM